MQPLIRTIYLYLFALVGLFVFIFSLINLAGAVLDRYIWPQEFVQYDYRTPTLDETKVAKEQILTVEQQKEQFIKQQNNDFKRRVNQAAPGVVVGWLLWWFHWGWIKRDRKRELGAT